MDTPNLTKMRNIIRDKWTWETGSDEDKEFLDFIETELDSRESAAISPEPYFKVIGEVIKFNDIELFRKSHNFTDPVELGDGLSKAIREMLAKSINGYSYTAYSDDNIGRAVVQRIESEIHTTLRATLESVISSMITTELMKLEDRLRDDVRCKIHVLKLELGK